MIERIRQQITSSPWVVISGLMASGTIAFIAVWSTFTSYHDSNLTEIAMLKTTVKSNSEWRVEAEHQLDEIRQHLYQMKGELDVFRRQHDNLERVVQDHIQHDAKVQQSQPESR